MSTPHSTVSPAPNPELAAPESNGNGHGEAALEGRHATHQVSAEVAAQIRTLRGDAPEPATAAESGRTPRLRPNWLLWSIVGTVTLAVVVWGTVHLLGGWSFLTGSVYGITAGGDRVFLDDLKLQFQRISRGNVDSLIIEKGELEAERNLDVTCKVRSSGRGDSPVGQIKWLVDEGKFVEGPILGQHLDNEAILDAMTLAGWTCPSVAPTLRTAPWLVTGHFNGLLRGEKVVELDSSGIEEQIQSHQIIVEKSKALLVQSENDRKIVESQNETDIKVARNNVDIAKINLRKYLGDDYNEGELGMERNALAGRKTLAQSDVMQWEDRASWSERMVIKRYMAAVQAESDQNRLRKAQIELRNVLVEQGVLENFKRQGMELDLTTKWHQAEQLLKTAEIQSASKMAKAEADYQQARSTLDADLTKLRDLKEDLRNCTMYAPGTGTIVYFMQEQDLFRGGGQQRLVAVNESVKQDQKLMRIPDLSKMQVKIKVHESLAPRLRSSRNGGALGQPAKIKLAAQAQALRGHVKSVSPVASQADRFGSDVRVHPTVVVIDEDMSQFELKPGMSADVTIFVEECPDVVRVPVHAVIEAAGQKFCYAKEGSEIKRRNLKTGANNNSFLEVKEGLQENEEVVQNPRPVAERLGDLKDDSSEEDNSAYKRNTNGTSPGAEGNTPRGTGPRGTGPRREGRDAQPGPGAGGPGGGGAGGGGSGGGGFQMTEEQRAQREKEMAEFKDSLKKAKTPAEKKALFDKRIADMDRRMAERVPDEAMRQQFLGGMKQRLKDDLAKDGIVIPD